MTKTTLNLRIEKELKDRLATKLKDNGETATDVVTRALEAYCNDSNATVTLDSNASNAGVTPPVTMEEVNSLKKRMEALQEQLTALRCNAVTLDQLKGWAIPYDCNAPVTPPVTQSGNDAVTPHSNDDVTQPVTPDHNASNDTVTLEEEGSAIAKPSENTPSEIPTEQPETNNQDESPQRGEGGAIAPMSQKDLATRMERARSSVSGAIKNGEDHFKQWSKKRDPDGIAWRWDAEQGLCFPMNC